MEAFDIQYDDALENEIREIVRLNPRNYVRVLNSRGFKNRSPDRKYLVDYIYRCTPLLKDGVHTMKTRIYWTLNRMTEFPVCGNVKHGEHRMEAANVKKLEEGYPKYCGTKCQHEAPSFYEAIKSSMKDKYGVENAFQLDSVKKDLACRKTEIQARRDETRKKNFGDEKSWNLKKSVETRRRLYGSAWNTAAIARTKLEKYGDSGYNNSAKAYKTKKRNGNLNTSIQERTVFTVMQTIMPDLVAQYKSDKYPFACDAYDPASDVYFEYNGTWTHGGRPFDPTSTEDAAKVEAWKSKNTEFYDNAVETWTVRDPKKRETARANGLTLVEFWNYSDVEKYFNLSFKIKDVEDSDSETFSQVIYKTRREQVAALPDSIFEKSHAAFMNYDFPFASLKDGQIRAELRSLAGNDLGDRTRSAVIKSFHRSMAGCRRAGLDSPMQYWNGLKDDYLNIKDVWRDVFVNRYVYGNSSDADRLRSDWTMSPNLVLEAVTVSKKAAFVSYLKPALAKRLAKTYLRAYDQVFCPFNGFSGIMLGCTVGCGKKFVGRDINATEIEESRQIVEKARRLGFDVDADLGVADVFKSSGTYDCMLCCPPYQDIEQWNFDADGRNSDRNLACEKWIDECLVRFDCGRYVFVVDEKTVGKYASNVVERLENRSHFGVNYECVVVIDRRGK